MIIDFKYHITSLVAVFLALAIGIVAGSVMLGNDTIVWQQEQLTDSIASELRSLRLENKQLRQKVSTMENYIHQQNDFDQGMLKELCQARLKGLQIAVIDTADTGLVDEVVAKLKLAGATVGMAIVVKDDLGLGSDLKQRRVVDYLGLEEQKSTQVALQLAKQVARGIMPGDNHAVLNLLVDDGLIKRSGESGNPVNVVLLLGGKRDFVEGEVAVRAIDVPIIEYLQQAGLQVYGAEAVNTAVSYMPIYQRYQLSTVDNVDTVPGMVALVLALEGRKGNYGVKATATSLLPLTTGQENR